MLRETLTDIYPPATVSLDGGPHIGDLVQITWDDAWMDSDELSPDQFKDSCQLETVGWMVRDSESVISVAAEKMAENSWRATTHIPKGIVRHVEVLKRGSS